MKVYVVTAGDYSSYHIEAVFTNRKMARIYANLDTDRRVETFDADNIQLDAKDLTLYVSYNYVENKIEDYSVIDHQVSDPNWYVSEYDYVFSFYVLASGNLLASIAEEGKKSEHLLKVSYDEFNMYLDTSGMIKRDLIKKVDNYHKRSRAYRNMMASSSMSVPIEPFVDKETTDKINAMYDAGEPLPDVLTLLKMVRENKKGENENA